MADEHDEQDKDQEESDINSDLTPMVLYSVPQRVPVTIDGNDYTIVELTGEERDNFLNLLAGRTKFDSKGNPSGIKDSKGIQANLISKGLIDNETNKKVSLLVIQGWSASTQMKLFKRIHSLSGLGEDAKEKAKNE